MNISEDHGFARSDDPVDPLYKQPFRYAEPKNGLLPALTVGEDLAIYHMTWPTVACARHAMSELATRRCTKTPEARHGRVHERASRAKQVVTPADQVHSYCARQLLVSMICKKVTTPSHGITPAEPARQLLNTSMSSSLGARSAGAEFDTQASLGEYRYEVFGQQFTIPSA